MLDTLMDINTLDIVVVCLLLISGIFAFVRGMAHEFLSLLGWVIAYFGARFITPLVQGPVIEIVKSYPSVEEWIKTMAEVETFVHVAMMLLFFILIAIAFYFINHRLVKYIRISRLNFIDRSLGFAFGLARGALLVSILYMLAMWVWEAEKMPKWISEAKTASLMESGALFIQSFIPEDLKPETAIEKEKQEKAKRKDEKLTIKQVLTPKDEKSGE